MSEIYKYLYNLEKYGILLGLDNINILLNLFENPHKRYPSIHIVGTNGKGSTAAFISTILRKSGYRVGVYTSPHLVNFSERITISGEAISENDIERIAVNIRETIKNSTHADRPFTFFEVTTALAFIYFAEKNIDIAVIEAGLGGRLDATNVLSPLVTVITTIGLEHKEFLGDTLEKIAYEKAAVIKHNTPCVTGVKEEEALKVIIEEAQKKTAPLYLLGKEFSYTPISNYEFKYKGISKTSVFKLKKLVGINQFDNASLAIVVSEILQNKGFAINEDAMHKGIEEAVWQGRFEIVRDNPPFIIDGAHNPQGVESLVKNLKTFFKETKFIIILNILRDKDAKEMVEHIKPFAEKIIFVPNNNERSLKLNDYKTLFVEDSFFSFAKDISSVINNCFEDVTLKNKPVLFTGSLYGIGEAKVALEKWIKS